MEVLSAVDEQYTINYRLHNGRGRLFAMWKRLPDWTSAIITLVHLQTSCSPTVLCPSLLERYKNIETRAGKLHTYLITYRNTDYLDTIEYWSRCEEDDQIFFTGGRQHKRVLTLNVHIGTSTQRTTTFYAHHRIDSWAYSVGYVFGTVACQRLDGKLQDCNYYRILLLWPIHART